MDNRIMPYCDWEFIRDFIERTNWRTAKTYANSYPHQYALRKDCSDKEFLRFRSLVRKYGYYYAFFKQRYLQLNVNGHYYWTMGNESGDTTVINRKERKVEAVGGQGIKTPFDIVSDEDTRGDEFDRMAIAERIRQHNLDGQVLEIGCGGGLMTQMLDLKRENYLGIDPSWKMIEEFRRTQNLIAWHTDFESLNIKMKYDFIFAACGSAAYVRPEYWDRLKNMLAEGGTYLLTFYTTGYSKALKAIRNIGGICFYADDMPKPTFAGNVKSTIIGDYTVIEGLV